MSIQKSVEIKAGLERPLTLTPHQFNLENQLTYTLEELEKGKRFRIVFQSIPGRPQTYQGYLKLKTNYPERPLITIRIRGRIHRGKQG